MSHKVGDIVYIRTVESLCREFNCEKWKGILGPEDYPSGFVSDMWRFCGLKAKIQHSYSDGSYGLDDIDGKRINYNWDDWMFESEPEIRYKKLRGLYE